MSCLCKSSPTDKVKFLMLPGIILAVHDLYHHGEASHTCLNVQTIKNITSNKQINVIEAHSKIFIRNEVSEIEHKRCMFTIKQYAQTISHFLTQR